MDAPYYNAAPGERASDPEWQRREVSLDAPIKPRLVTCTICGARVRVLTAHPSTARVVCDDCVLEGHE